MAEPLDNTAQYCFDTYAPIWFLDWGLFLTRRSD